MKLIFLISLLLSLIFTGCSSHAISNLHSPSPQKSATSSFVPPSPAPSNTATFIPSSTPAYTKTQTPTPQILQRLFPTGFDSRGVWSNENTGNDIVEMDFDIHFDIGLPRDFETGSDFIIAPTSGEIVKVHPAGEDEGQVIIIRPSPELLGIQELVTEYGYDSSQIVDVKYYVGHITPIRSSGWIEVGEPLGTAYDGWWHPNKIAHMLLVAMANGQELQFSPCEIQNSTSYCGKCYPGTPYNCP